MACEAPPALTDSELLAFVDGEADPRVVEHMERCRHCGGRAGRLAHMQDRLTSRLYRLDCPLPLELGDYHLEMLSPERGAAVEAHLVKCPLCAQEIAQLQDYIKELKPDLEVSRSDRGRILIAQLISGGRGLRPQMPPTLQPAFAVRGEEEETLIFKAENIQIVVDIQRDPGTGRADLLGLVTGTDLRELTAYLLQGGQKALSAKVDDGGNFVLPDLPPGDFILNISGPDFEIHTPTLEI